MSQFLQLLEYCQRFLSGPTNNEHLRVVVMGLVDEIKMLRERIGALEREINGAE